ncbi:hypothetical protein JD79_00950 [Geodermatophilus normandii]|uniref:DUF7402 domain-containing protein n=1 Tax=Geodermatophilus normandii TaxID=1137989 RepID=A0A317QFF7_9ACTN|nr:hypothetical protein [Geodermatophilus normandii]PWW21809.1 hypothetical protein JD79_00950 [Geodermatophilus normandii]
MCQTMSDCSSRPEGTWLPRQHLATERYPSQLPDEGNAALSATATASSQNTTDGETAAKAINGVADGYPGDHTKESAVAPAAGYS